MKNTKNTATLQPMTKEVTKMAEKSGIVFIGNKPPMDYVLAVLTKMSSGNSKEVILKARGQAITTAVDVSQIITRRFLKDLKIGTVAIGTEEMPPREGESRSRMVSTMEITMTK